MDIKPIEIDIEDNWKFTQVALFVDQSEFLSDIAYGRKKLKVPETLIVRDNVDYWSELADVFDADFDQGKKRLLHRFPLIEQFIWDMLEKYHKTSLYRSIIKYALLTGKVEDSDLPKRSAHIRLIDQEEYARTWIAGIKYPTEFAIIISPETTEEDIRRVYRDEFLSFAKSHQKRMKEKFGSENSKTKLNFQEARKWYWLHKHGLSIAEISRQDVLHGKPRIDKVSLASYTRTASSRIGKAIKRYGEALNASSLFKNADN